MAWAALTKDKHDHLGLYSSRNKLVLEGIQAEDCVNLVETVCVECVRTHCVLQRTCMFCTDTFLFGSLFRVLYTRMEKLFVLIHRN